MIIPIGKSFMIIPDPKVNTSNVDVNGIGLEELPLWMVAILVVIIIILFGFVIRELTKK